MNDGTFYIINPLFIWNFSIMRLIIIVLLASFYWIDALDQDGSQSSNGQPHIARKLEDYAHDMEYDRFPSCFFLLTYG